MIECCGNCKHYKEAYCSLMDELVEPEDNCGMCDIDIVTDDPVKIVKE